MPEPIVSREDGVDPEHEALLADSVGLALLVVLETLAPAERLAFVLHDMFARAVRRDRRRSSIARRPRRGSSRAARAVACAAQTPAPDADLARQREVVDAFLAAARDGDFDALLAVLDPDVVLRADARRGPRRRVERGPRRRGGRRERALASRSSPAFGRPALVNGAAGIVVAPHGRPVLGLGFTVADGKIVEIDILADPERLRRLDLTMLDA